MPVVHTRRSCVVRVMPVDVPVVHRRLNLSRCSVLINHLAGRVGVACGVAARHRAL